MSEFRMPSLGADMEAGTLVEWLKKPGETVRRGDIIAVVDTQKGAIEVEVHADGVIERVLVQPGTRVPVGTVLAVIRDEAGAQPSAHEARPTAPAPMASSAESMAVVAPATAAAAPQAPRRRVSPAARKAAERLRLDLALVEGTGPGGAVTVADVERDASATPTPAPAPGPSPMRLAIAAAMARSKREIPHLYLSTVVELSVALGALAARNERLSVTARVLPIALMIRAVARAAADVPEANGFWVEGAFRSAGGVHVGCAIALRDGGLVAPAIHDADKKPASVLMRELQDLVARARTGKLRSSELADPTITVTSLGDLGVETVLGIIYPPQVAIVGFGRIVERPWVVDGRIEPRSVVTVSLSADHRAVDGRRAGRFLSAVERWLQSAEDA